MSNVSFSRKESYEEIRRLIRVINIILGDPFGPKPFPYQFTCRIVSDYGGRRRAGRNW
jgi:hypothetical protein